MSNMDRATKGIIGLYIFLVMLFFCGFLVNAFSTRKEFIRLYNSAVDIITMKDYYKYDEAVNTLEDLGIIKRHIIISTKRSMSRQLYFIMKKNTIELQIYSKKYPSFSIAAKSTSQASIEWSKNTRKYKGI